jgi:hypothetical protein
MMLPAGQLAITPSLGKNSGATSLMLLMLPGAGFAASLNLKQTLSLQFGKQTSGESGVCLQPFFPSYITDQYSHCACDCTSSAKSRRLLKLLKLLKLLGFAISSMSSSSCFESNQSMGWGRGKATSGKMVALM